MDLCVFRTHHTQITFGLYIVSIFNPRKSLFLFISLVFCFRASWRDLYKIDSSAIHRTISATLTIKGKPWRKFSVAFWINIKKEGKEKYQNLFAKKYWWCVFQHLNEKVNEIDDFSTFLSLPLQSRRKGAVVSRHVWLIIYWPNSPFTEQRLDNKINW